MLKIIFTEHWTRVNYGVWIFRKGRVPSLLTSVAYNAATGERSKVNQVVRNYVIPKEL